MSAQRYNVVDISIWWCRHFLTFPRQEESSSDLLGLNASAKV